MPLVPSMPTMQAKIDGLKQLRRDNVAAREAIVADLASRLERTARGEDQERDEGVQKNKSGMKFRVQKDALVERQAEWPLRSGYLPSDDDVTGSSQEDNLVTWGELSALLDDIAAITGQADGENGRKLKALEDRMALLERISRLEQDVRELRCANGIERESEGVVFALPPRGKNVA